MAGGQEVCRFFLQGRCKFGDKCRNLHHDSGGYGGQSKTQLRCMMGRGGGGASDQQEGSGDETSIYDGGGRDVSCLPSLLRMVIPKVFSSRFKIG